MAIINTAGIKTTITTEEVANSVDGSVVIQSDNIQQALVNVPEQHYTPRFFGSVNGAVSADLFLADGTFIPTIRLNHGSSGSYQAISFECTALSDIPPTLTVYWTTTGITNSVVYATCSSNAPSAFNWVPPKKSYSIPVINTIAFTPGTNYTEALIGGDFNSVGSLTANNQNYFTVNLSGGPNILSGGLIFGPVGSVITNTPTTSTYYGGVSGIRFNGEVTCILPVSVAPGQEYICYGGKFTGVQIYNSQTVLSCVGLFIVDKSQPLNKYVRFNLNHIQYPNTVTAGKTIPLALEYDYDNKTLLVGGSAFIDNPSLQQNNTNASMYNHLTASNSTNLSKRVFEKNIPLFRLNLVSNVTAADLWNRFDFVETSFSESFSKQIYGSSPYITIQPLIKTLKYFKNVLYVGGNFRSIVTDSVEFGVSINTPNNLVAIRCRELSYLYNGKATYTWIYGDTGYEYVWSLKKWFIAGSGGYCINNIEIQKINEENYILYLMGNYIKSQEYSTISKTLVDKPEAPYLAAYDITKSLYDYPGTKEFPKYLSAWNPIFDKPVVDLDYNQQDQSLYIIGGFTKVTAVVEGKKVAQPASRFVILSQPNLNDETAAIVHKPYINIAGGAFSYFDIVKVIPDGSPLSGVLVTTNMATINLAPAKVIARLPRKDKSISPAVAKHIQWNISSKVVNVGDSIAVDTTQFDAVTAYPGENYQLQKLIYNPPLEPGVGDLMRFYIQRSNDQNPNQLSASPIWITGIKVSHEQ